MDSMNPITNDDMVTAAMTLVAVMILGVFLYAIFPDKTRGKFYAECESNNGVVIMTGRGEGICIKKTAVIDL